MSASPVVQFGCQLSETALRSAVERLAGDAMDYVVVPVPDVPGAPSPFRCLPLQVAALAAAPHQTAALIARSASATGDEAWPKVLEAIDSQRAVVAVDLVAQAATFPRPSLVSARVLPAPNWRKQRIELLSEQLQEQGGAATDCVAIEAGVLQLAGLLEESHEAAQSIEGEGWSQSGDYWHAIHHRREPDYGNAKYWFRRVGRHPVLAPLARDVAPLIEAAPSPARDAAEGLIRNGLFDPLRFVDFAEQAADSSETALLTLAEEIQWAEMIRLLSATVRDALGHR